MRDNIKERLAAYNALDKLVQEQAQKLGLAKHDVIEILAELSSNILYHQGTAYGHQLEEPLDLDTGHD